MKVTPERWRQIARLYELAIEKSASERELLLEENCAGDDTLRREVESLLRQDATLGVLDRPVWAAAAALFGESPDLASGSFLGPYRIEGPLGAGGMGMVYRATDTRLNRAVAIKVLPPDVALDQQVRARFAREARAVAALTHPHICMLHDVGRQDEVDYIVMEHLDGRTLAARLAEGPLPVDQALMHAIEVASALDHAHRHGIVHRDLKPGNIMLTDGGAKLLDFGLAKFRAATGAGRTGDDATRADAASAEGASDRLDGDESQVTSGGAILGTVRYMAPEQIAGRQVDARSDLFSFGAVVFEMLTGVRAFAGDNAAAVRTAILEQDPPRVSSLQPMAPAAIDEIVRRCLRKNPDERFQSGSDLLLELRALEPASSTSHGWTRTAGLLIAVLAGLVAWGMPGGVSRWWTTPPSGEIRSVAVLPLENLSGDPEQEYFADGVTEQLIADLARARALRVISRTSVMHYRQARKPVPTIARELNVDGIVEGSVAHAGEKVRVTVRLLRGATGEILWTQSFERDQRDVLALQNDVARTIATRLDVGPSPRAQSQTPSARPVVDPEAHRQVLLGRHYAAKSTEDGLRRAVQHFDAAIAKDPANALAHAGLAEAYVGLSGFYLDPREVMPAAKRAAETAVRLDPSLAYPHATLGFIHLVYDWDGPAAERALMRALDLNPTLAAARLSYAAFLTSQERHDEAAREIQRAVDLDPLSIRTHAFGTLFMLFTRRFDDAIELARRGLEFEPNGAFALAFQGVGYAEQGRFDEAVRALERAARLDASLTIKTLHAQVLAIAGRRAEARKALQEVEEAARHRYFCPYEIGSVYVSLGDADKAHDWFRKGVNERADCMAWLGVEPWIDPFRSDPRYPDLVRDIGLSPAR